MKIFAKIKSYFVIVTTAFYVSIYIFYGLFGKKKDRLYSRRKWISRRILAVNDISVEVIGTPKQDVDVIIVNHQSMIDIMVIETIFKGNIAWVAKKELFKIPFFGLLVKLPRMIALDRQNKKGLIKLLKDAKDRHSQGRPIAIFPEGTRAKKNTFLPFKPGAEIVANSLDATVQCAVISNTKKVLNFDDMLAYPCTIKVTLLEPFKAKEREKGWLQVEREKMLKVFLHEQ